jgi:RimJ/RimL family protein N-acetyltransferase
MIREATADEVNAIANDPSVYDMLLLGALHPQCALDYSEQIDHPFVTALMIDGFAALFVWTSPGTYECHIMARKEVRGRKMIEASREMLAYMKSKGARRIWGQPSAYNPAAISFVKLMGLQYQDTGHHPVVGDVVYYEMEL